MFSPSIWLSFLFYNTFFFLKSKSVTFSSSPVYQLVNDLGFLFSKEKIFATQGYKDLFPSAFSGCFIV